MWSTDERFCLKWGGVARRVFTEGVNTRDLASQPSSICSTLLMNPEGVNGVSVVLGSLLLPGVWTERRLSCFLGETKSFGWDVDLVRLCLIARESPAWITPEGVLKPSLERKGVPLNTGILGVRQSGESTTSKATRLFSVGVLVTGVFLPGMGDSGVLVNFTAGDSAEFTGVEEARFFTQLVCSEQSRQYGS